MADAQENNTMDLRSYILRGEKALGAILLERFVQADNRGIVDYDIVSAARQLSSEIGATVLYKRNGSRSFYYWDRMTAQRCGLRLPPEGARVVHAANTRFIDYFHETDSDG